MNKWNLKIKKTSFTSTSKTNLTKYVHDLYEENYKTLMNKMKNELNK